MGDTLIKHYVVGIIIFVLMGVGVITIMSEFAVKNPDITSDPKYQEFNQSFNKLENIQEHVTNMRTNTEGMSITSDPLGVLGSLINAGWNALKTVLDGLDFMTDVFNSTTTLFGVPAWIPLLVGFIPIVIIIYLILSAIFQKDV